MNFKEQRAPQDQYRLILVLPRGQMVLVECHEQQLRLPCIEIPARTRRAEQVAIVLKDKWNLRSIVIAFLQGSPGMPACAVIEIRTYDWRRLPSGLVPIRIEVLGDLELTASEHIAVRDILTGQAGDRDPFRRLGWIEEAQEWIRESLPGRIVEFNDDVRRSNVGSSFALVRFGTFTTPAYWLKATGVPNAHEFNVTTTLARLFPNYLPALVAARQDWNAWVTEEMGRSLQDTSSLYAFEQAVRCLSQLQRASLDHVNVLLDFGCFDQRMPIVRAHLPELMRYLEEVMATQTSTKVRPIERKRLCELGNVLEDACGSLELIGIPEPLIHNDMNMGNVLFDGERAVFTDWAEAHIGHPFFTFQHLRAQSLKVDTTCAWAPRLKTIYQEQWSGLLGGTKIERALALCPPLAIASYLYGRDPSFTSQYREDPGCQSYARSLARHMNLTAQDPEFLGAICN